MKVLEGPGDLLPIIKHDIGVSAEKLSDEEVVDEAGPGTDGDVHVISLFAQPVQVVVSLGVLGLPRGLVRKPLLVGPTAAVADDVIGVGLRVWDGRGGCGAAERGNGEWGFGGGRKWEGEDWGFGEKWVAAAENHGFEDLWALNFCVLYAFACWSP